MRRGILHLPFRRHALLRFVARSFTYLMCCSLPRSLRALPDNEKIAGSDFSRAKRARRARIRDDTRKMRRAMFVWIIRGSATLGFFSRLLWRLKESHTLRFTVALPPRHSRRQAGNLKYGTVQDAIAELGISDTGIREMFVGFQRHLYTPQEAA